MKTLQHKQRVAILIGVAIVIVVAIGIVNIANVKKLVGMTLTQQTKPGARIYFAPGLISFTGVGNKSVDLVIDTGGNAVGQVTIRLAYDPKLLTNVKIIPADFSKANYTVAYNLTQGAINTNTGMAYLAYAVTPKTGNADAITPRAVKIATISFTIVAPLKPGQKLFTFLPLTAVYPPSTPVAFSLGSGGSAPTLPKPQSLLQVVEPLQGQ